MTGKGGRRAGGTEKGMDRERKREYGDEMKGWRSINSYLGKRIRINKGKEVGYMVLKEMRQHGRWRRGHGWKKGV